MIVCDKCKKPIDAPFILVGGRRTEQKSTMSFEIHRIDKDSPCIHDHDLSLDICPSCQEEIIKTILGFVPWVEGK